MDLFATSLPRPLALALLVAAAVILIVALVITWEAVQLPFLGVFTEPTLIVPGTGEEEWARHAAGLGFPHRLLALDGQALDSPTALIDLLDGYRVGETVSVTALNTETGAETTVEVLLIAMPDEAFLSFFILPYLLAWIYLAVGLWVMWTQRRGEVAPIFAALCALVVLVIGLILDLYVTHRLWWAWVAAFPLAGSALLHLGTVFPQRIESLARWRWLVYLPGIALAVIGVIATGDWDNPTRYFDPWFWGRMWTGVGALVFAALVLYHRFFPSSPVVRAQSRTVLWGAVLSFTPYIIWNVASRQVGLPFPPLLVLPWLALFPLSIAYSIPHSRTLDIGWVLRQATVYGLLTAVIVGGYFAMRAVLAGGLGGTISLDDPGALTLFVLLTVVGLLPAQRGLTWLVNHLLWGRQASHRQALDGFSRSVSVASSQEDVLRALGEAVREAISTPQASLYLLDEQKNRYVSHAFIGTPPAMAFGRDDPLALRMLEGGGSVYLSPTTAPPPELEGSVDQLAELDVVLMLPVVGEGWMVVGAPHLGRFRTDDLQFLEELAKQASSALDRVHLVSDLERRVTELEALRLIAESLSYSVELEDLFELIYTQTSRVLKVKNFYIALYEPTTGVLHFGFYVEKGERLEPDEVWKDDQGLSGIIVRTRKTIVTADYVSECRQRGVHPGGKPGKAWMGAPLISGDRVLGVINVSSFDPEVTYTDEQAQIFSAIAAQAASIIDKARLYQEMDRRAGQLQTLYEIGSAITASLDLDVVLALIMDKAVELLQTEAGSLLLVDQDTGDLMFEVTTGPSTADLVGVRLSTGTGIVGQVAREARPLIVHDVTRDERWDSRTDRDSGFNTRSVICVPLVARGRVIGVIELLNRRDGKQFDSDDQDLLMAFAAQAAAALDNARLFTMTDEALAARVDELSIMQRIDRELNAALDYRRVLDIALDWAVRTTGADVGLLATISETEDGRRGLRFLANHGYPEEDMAVYEETLWPLGQGVIGRAAQTGEPTLVEDVGQDPDYVATVPGMISQLTVPIRREGDSIGVISLESVRSGGLDRESMEFVVRLADHAAIAIENASLFEAVQAANNAKTEFISFVSHELQQPMTAMKGYADLLASGVVGELNEEQASFLEVIRSNVGRMSALVRDLLDVSRIEAGRLRLELGAVAVKEAVEEAVSVVKERIESKGQSLKLKVQSDLEPVHADRQRLVQVLTNLLSNAYKYTPEGGDISLSAQADGGDGGMVVFAVKDSGIGISEEDQERMFVKYFRSQDPFVRDVQGTGLGLAITKSLVELQGGEIWLESQLGVGSKFSFTVPLMTE